MKNLIFTVLSLLHFSFLMACSCDNYIEEFCSSADATDNIALVTLTGFDITAGNTSGATFSLIENLNSTIPSTISVLSADDFNCNLDLSQFAIGDTLVINVTPYTQPSPNTFNAIEYNFGIEDCARNHLTYSNGVVHGKLDTINELEELDYDSFRAGLFNCISFSLSNEEIDGLDINLYPNPTNGELFINASELEIKEVKLYDLKGILIDFDQNKFSNSHRIIIPAHHNGILILEIMTPRGILRRKVVKVNQ